MLSQATKYFCFLTLPPGPRPWFLCSGSGSQFLLTGPQPPICFHQPWLIRAGKKESQKLHMLLFLFLMPNSFVTAIDCCSLLLFVYQVVFRYLIYYHQQLVTSYLFHKQSSANFRNIHYKTPVLEFLFDKVSGLKALTLY